MSLALMTLPALAQEVPNSPDTKAEGAKSFGDWRLRCEVPSGSTAEQCALMQTVVAEDHPDLGSAAAKALGLACGEEQAGAAGDLIVRLTSGRWLHITRRGR